MHSDTVCAFLRQFSLLEPLSYVHVREAIAPFSAEHVMMMEEVMVLSTSLWQLTAKPIETPKTLSEPILET